MTTKRYFACLALSLGVIVVFNILLTLRLDSVPKLIVRDMQATPQIDALFLGNSLMQADFDPKAFAAGWPGTQAALSTFNAGLGSSSPVEHFVLAHQAYRQHETIRYIVYGFYDFQLTDPPGHAWSELEGNRAMAYSMEPSTSAELYAPGSTWEKWRFALIGAVPMLRDHFQLWKYVEIFRRHLNEIGIPGTTQNEFGRVADFEEIAAPDVAKFDREAESAVVHSAPLIPAIQQLLKLTRDHHTRLIVVEMPMTSRHRKNYYSSAAWQKYRAHLQQQLQAGEALYVEASDWVPDDADFSDGLHLNVEGARLFSRKMAEDLEFH